MNDHLGSLRNRKILVLEQIASPNHFETSLEIALQLAENGNQVTYIHLGNRLKHIEFRRVPRWLGILFLYREFGWLRPIYRGVELAKKEAERKKLPVSFTIAQRTRVRAPRAPIRTLLSVARLQEWENEYGPIGVGVASSLVNKLRSSTAIPLFHPILLADIVHAYAVARDAFAQEAGGGYSDVVVFNGRFAFSRGVIDIARSSATNVLIHERGGADNNGFFFEDFTPHDNVKRAAAQLSFWKSSLEQNRDFAVTAASSFFYEKRMGTLAYRDNFTSHQEPNENRKVSSPRSLAFFCSSDDETVSLGEYAPKSHFPSQREAVKILISLASKKNWKLLVRVHPGIRKRSYSERLWWSRANPLFWDRSCRLISPGSKRNSYDVLDSCSAAVAWRSSMGLEAVFWQKPSLLLAEAFYHVGGAGTQLVDSKQSLSNWLDNPELNPPTSESVLPFGYWAATSKHRFKYYEAESWDQGRFFGENLFRIRRRLRER